MKLGTRLLRLLSLETILVVMMVMPPLCLQVQLNRSLCVTYDTTSLGGESESTKVALLFSFNYVSNWTAHRAIRN